MGCLTQSGRHLCLEPSHSSASQRRIPNGHERHELRRNARTRAHLRKPFPVLRTRHTPGNQWRDHRHRRALALDGHEQLRLGEQATADIGRCTLFGICYLPIANNSLTSDEEGAISGGGGFADSYYQPLILGWRKQRADIRAVYGFLAPTGKFTAGANNNVGSGYWTNTLAAGETAYLTKNKATAISAFEMYEFHTTQQGTQIHPGETFDLDYSLTQALSLQRDLSLQLGLVGYGQYQTTDKTGPNITPAQATAHYKVNALGFASNVILPSRKVSTGFKFFKEFSNRSTFQGYSVQISIAISF
jgi:hypothetical protein